MKEQYGQDEEQRKLLPLSTQQAILTGGTLAATGIADIAMHGGATGLFLGALATFVVARHSGDIVDAVRPGKDSERIIASTARVLSATTHTEDSEDNTDQSVPAKLKRLFRLDAFTTPLQGVLKKEELGKPQHANRRGSGYLNLSDTYQPHVNDILGHCILCVGQRGTGKSNVAARLCEQIGQYPIPLAIIDYKQDYITLPSMLERCVIAGSPDWQEKEKHMDTGYWELDKDNAFDAGYTILNNGVQMCFQVISYENINAAAEVILGIIKGMFAWAQQQQAGKRIPALVLLDEAQQFLPQQSGISQIDQALSLQLLSAFERLNSIGRSLGLTPAFFTQRVAQIKKEVIGGSEIFWLLKQSLDQDLKVYEALLGKENIDRRAIQSFQSGEALVYSSGDIDITRFYERESEHLSVTPGLDDALGYYGSRRFSTSLVNAREYSQRGPEFQNVSVERMEDLPMREHVNEPVERVNAREYAVNVPGNSRPSVNAVNASVKVSAEHKEAILKAIIAMQMDGEKVTRTGLRDRLEWDNRQYQEILKPALDEMGLLK